MITPRRLTFQLTPLLDLLLIVIFAQYMEVRSTTESRAEEYADAIERAETLERELPKATELAGRVEDLEEEKAALENDLESSQRRMQRLSDRFTEVFRINEETLAEMLDADDPHLSGLTEEELAKLRERLGELVRSKGAEALEQLVMYEELLKRADVWRVRVGTVDQAGAVTFRAGDREETFKPKSAEDFAAEIFKLYKSLPQPKSHVVILLNYDNARTPIVKLNQVRDGLPQVVNRVQADGNSKVFWAEIGYDPRVLGLPE